MIFEELVLAPLIPGRVPKTRDELLAMFPGQGHVVLDNRVTTVKRVFRRILPVLIPADPTESLGPEERFAELLEILRASKKNRLWLAFLTNPMPGPEESTGSSLDLAARPAGKKCPGRRLPRTFFTTSFGSCSASGSRCPFTNILTISRPSGPRWRPPSATRARPARSAVTGARSSLSTSKD